MEYNSESHIENIDQVKDFLRYLTSDGDISILPEENEHLTVKELHLFDRLTEEALSVCEREGVDLYALTSSALEQK